MNQKFYKILGKFLLSAAIITFFFKIFLTFKDGEFRFNYYNFSFSTSLYHVLVYLIAILSGFRIKKKYPEYYKYQIASGAVLLSMTLIFDMIPMIIN